MNKQGLPAPYKKLSKIVLIEKISTPNRSIKEPEFKERIIHNFQVLPSLGFNASHSAVENVVVITGKLISLPYGLKTDPNSESRYQQFYFLLCLSADHTPPHTHTPGLACLFLSFCFYLIFQPYLLPLPHHSPSLIPLFQPWATHFEAILIKHSADLRGNCSVLSRSWHISIWSHSKKRTKDALWPSVNRLGHFVPKVWSHDWKKNNPINLSATGSP